MPWIGHIGSVPPGFQTSGTNLAEENFNAAVAEKAKQTQTPPPPPPTKIPEPPKE
jgi:hypothetical protein